MPPTDHPHLAIGDAALIRARSMYARVISGWASDALRLRAVGIGSAQDSSETRCISDGARPATSRLRGEHGDGTGRRGNAA